MRVPRLKKEGKKVRVTLSITESDLALVKEYARFYEIIYDEEIKDYDLIVHTVKTCMEADKEFINYLDKIVNGKKDSANKGAK